jgi:wyosine [tRNA(Phe)-imidazoG37] synthetase (radical SAM superfamily)
VARALEATLRQMAADGQHPDVLTFAGNGEPTAHPEFAGIIDDTIRLRDALCPLAKVSVLSNATQLHRKDVFDALLRVDNNIQKLDTVDIDFIRRIDRPVNKKYDVETIIEQLRQFHGHVIIQTMFLKGVAKLRSSEVENLDNTTDDFVLPWLDAVKTIAPEQVMIYTIDRETPVSYLQKASHEELNRIRDMVIAEGIPCTASY